jgi:hypothetical protein
MENLKGALTIAEGDIAYKTDVSLAFGGSRIEKRLVLRTSLDSLAVWKAKFVGANMSPFDARIKSIVKEAALIDKEVWVFGIDATRAQDVVAAVEIACRWYKTSADKLMSDVYTKNLNAEHESTMGSQALVTANRKLYSSVSAALVEAAKLLGVRGAMNLWVISSVTNHKIPKEDLHVSLREGGAHSVELDPTPHQFYSKSNSGKVKAKVFTNLHLAKFNL